jgi:hypothetical protein
MVIIKIPARRLLIFSFVLRRPVQQPARNPQIMAIKIPYTGGTPSMIRRATTAAPSGKLPSTVRSGKARIRKVMTIPKATSP